MTPTTEQLKDLLDNVTPGPWYIDGGQVTSDTLHEMDCIVDHVYGTESNATIIALSPTLAAEVVRLRESLETVHSQASFHQEFYDRNGPQWTSQQGNEYEDTSAHLDSMNALAAIARQALDATSEK